MSSRTHSKPWTINLIKESARANGSHWFDPDTMRFFGSKIEPKVFEGPGGIYFVSSEQPPHGKRSWTVRKFTPPDDINTVGELCGHATREEAHLAAKEAAQGQTDEAVNTNEEEYERVSIREQFHFTMQKLLPSYNAVKVDKLMENATRHHKACEAYCNTGHDRSAPIEQAIQKLCASLGCEPLFQHDPRGCTVKLKVPSGQTDDFGKEGMCVPQHTLYDPDYDD